MNSRPHITRRQMFKLGLADTGALASATALGSAARPAQAAAPASTAHQVTTDAVKASVARLDALAADEIKAGAVPGIALAVVYKDEVVFAKGYGAKDASKTDATNSIDADTVFQLASLSKPIGSTAVAALVGEGVVSWDSRIADLDPSFALSDLWVTREIMISDMYSHRSGLPEYVGDLHEDLEYSREEILHSLRYVPLGKFRAQYAYTNFGMTAAAVAAARAAGATWESVIEQKIYAPLGMKSTSSCYADYAARKNRALGHMLVGGKWVAQYKRDADTESPAGGVSSSVNDLSKWVRLQLANGKFDGKQIVAEEPLLETHRPHNVVGYDSAGIPGFYGLGWNVDYHAQGKLRLSHSGAFALGAGTAVYLVPAESVGVVALTNGWPTGVAEALCISFLDLVLVGQVTKDWLTTYKSFFAQMMASRNTGAVTYAKPPEKPAPALANDAYVGTYTNDAFGNINIVFTPGGGLAIEQGPKPMTFALTHWNRDTFVYQTEGESASGLAGVTFTIGPDGNASSVVIENLSGNGQGTFVHKK